MDAPIVHPDLEWSVDALLLRAVHAKLVGDAPLVAFAAGGIHRIEHPDLWVQGDWLVPCLTIDLESSLEVVAGNDGLGRIETTIRIGLYTQMLSTGGDDDSLRSRVLDRIKGIVRRGDDGLGMFHDPDGNGLHLPLVKFLTDARAGRLRTKPKTLYNELRFTVLSDVQGRTRTWQ